MDLQSRTGRRLRGTSALGAALVAAIVFALPAAAVPPGWTTPGRVLQERFGPTHSMVVDKLGWTHIAVDGQTSPGIWYVSNAGGEGWFSIKVTHKWDFNPSIVVNPAGRVTIAFDRRDPDSLDGFASLGIYTVSNTTGTFRIKRRFAGQALYPSLALRNGRLHLAFQGNNLSLKYRTNASGSWVTSTVAGAGACCSGSPRIAVKGNGTPVIAWSKATAGSSGPLRFSHRTGAGTWSSETVDLKPTRDPSLVLSQGLANIAYVRGNATWRATPAGGGWNRLKIDPGMNQPPDIAANAAGTLYIVEGGAPGLRYVLLGADDFVSVVLTSNPADSNPEIGLFQGKPRVVFNRASGTTNDGIFFTKES